MYGGWRLYPDTPPGIGWILEAPPNLTKEGIPAIHGKKRYYWKREHALHAYETRYGPKETEHVP